MKNKLLTILCLLPILILACLLNAPDLQTAPPISRIVVILSPLGFAIGYGLAWFIRKVTKLW